MVIPVVMYALGAIPKNLDKRAEDIEIRGQEEIIQISALFRSARIVRRVMETRRILLSLKFH